MESTVGSTRHIAYETPEISTEPLHNRHKYSLKIIGDGGIGYPGTPLPDENHIRLVRMSRSSPDIIVLEWLTAPLAEAQEYFALSSVWGIPSDHGLLHHPSLNMTENLCIALLRLAEMSPRLWWVDALCINQTDKDEKSHQARMIGTIFGKARQVRIWIRNLMLEGRIDYRGFRSFKVPVAREEADSLGLPQATDPSWISYLRFLYFTRIWILYTINWNSVKCVTVWLEVHGKLDIVRVEVHGESDIVGDLLQLGTNFTITSVHLLRICNYDILRVLELGRFLKSTDPRDKVIAILGIALKHDSIYSTISINYEQTVPAFHRDVTSKIITITRSLDILELVEDHSLRIYKALPSWVPDYSVSARAVRAYSWYTASGRTPIAVKWIRGSDILVVHARAVGEVHCVVNCLNLPIETNKAYEILLSWFRSAVENSVCGSDWRWIQQLSGNEYPIDEALEQFWRTTVEDAAASPNYESPAPGVWRRHFADTIIEAFKKECAERPPTAIFAFLASLLNSKGDGEIFFRHWTRHADRKTFFITKQGRMGLGPMPLQPGDRITILSGVRCLQRWTDSKGHWRTGCKEQVRKKIKPKETYLLFP